MIAEFGKKYYKIKEVAELIGVPQSTLRFWESEFEQLKPKRNDHNRRYYTPEDIETVRIIHYLVKTQGHKIEYAKEELRKNKKNVSNKLLIVEELTNVKRELQQLLNSLNLRGKKFNLTEEND